MSPAVTVAFLVHGERKFARFVISRFELNPLQIEHDVGHVFDHAGQRGEFVLRAGDFDRGNGGAFERGKQHAAERVSDRVAVAGFKGFGDEFGVGFSGCALVLDEGLRHFKTTVTNWHFLKPESGNRKAESKNPNSEVQNPKSPNRRVSPGECGYASSDANPGTNGAT